MARRTIAVTPVMLAVAIAIRSTIGTVHHFADARRSCPPLSGRASPQIVLQAPETGSGWRERYAWRFGEDAEPLLGRVASPNELERLPAAEGSFGAWLRRLPVKPGTPPVRLFDGRLKANQSAHHAVVDIDVGGRDLQQCADAVIRLRAEYLWAAGCADSISFCFSSGDPASWGAWEAGYRPSAQGSSVTWARTAPEEGTYAAFRRYLDTVFTYAGSASLERELVRVSDPSKPEIGDVFIQGGFPGHAVLVADVAEDDHGRRWFVLVQSYMPAQEVHVLRNPLGTWSPWYPAHASGALVTPEWTFSHEDLHRFPVLG
ncbi:MAG: DUF4846 domain-containing protein, partial [Candidatus Eisenbacteria bacterium]|nr:DUF4846 domain-containing protein [Candidatus Eisenbacteria bacterium]